MWFKIQAEQTGEICLIAIINICIYFNSVNILYILNKSIKIYIFNINKHFQCFYFVDPRFINSYY